MAIEDVPLLLRQVIDQARNLVLPAKHETYAKQATSVTGTRRIEPQTRRSSIPVYVMCLPFGPAARLASRVRCKLRDEPTASCFLPFLHPLFHRGRIHIPDISHLCSHHLAFVARHSTHAVRKASVSFLRRQTGTESPGSRFGVCLATIAPFQQCLVKLLRWLLLRLLLRLLLQIVML